jgi:carbonic anhydrase/acetyltransferase-like protein (isoleucine patch superfamily)
MAQKYQILTNDTKTIAHPKTGLPVKLYRIYSLMKIRISENMVIPEGQIGGFIQSEKNLPNIDTDGSWILHNAMVFDNAVVRNNSFVMQNAAVWGDSVIDKSAIKEFVRVSGKAVIASSTLTGNVDVDGSTHVTNSVCKNYAKVTGNAIVADCELVNGAYIGDNSEVLKSKLYDYSRVYGNSYVIDCILQNGAIIRDKRIANQTISQDITLNKHYPEIQGQF